MTADQIETAVREVLADVTPRAASAERTTDLLDDLGLDSITVLELVSALEERFEITVPLNELAQIRTVGAVIDDVSRRLHQGSKA